MRYALGVFLALGLSLGMFMFSTVMARQAAAWASQGAALSPFQVLLIDIALWWHAYWYLGLLIIAAISIFVSMAFPGSKQTDHEN